MEDAKPKCPECKAEGMENIIANESNEFDGEKEPWYEVVNCKKCGHIYGVFTKTVKARVPRI